MIFRGRIRPAGAVPAAHAGPTHAGPKHAGGAHGRDAGGEYARTHLIAALLAAIEADPSLAAGIHPDGHGGYTEPPPGALTYRPSAEVAARVRMTYSTCTHPGCEIPSTRCELDHIVPFDHADPRRGGWSMDTNLHPVCTGHHQLKTAKIWTVALVTGGAILWTSSAGIRSITLPRLGCPTPPRTRKRGRKTPDPDITTETWWEKNMPADHPEPTAADQHTAATDAARTRIRILRRRFREHKNIQRLRRQAEPPPF